ncbi:MAG: glycosyltransferase family 39 protein [Nanoarchaeota archaeon]|nr:glycosyltransferase family 39 protein [Nanoarchaeota archaeon]MBU1103112.1 glycosyltransferase family 39 protein [Nanoarchaeota archaeon]
MSNETVGNRILNKSVDFIFSKNNAKYLLLIMIMGAILRGIVANNVGPVADEVVFGTHAIDIISSGVINNQNQAQVWFYLTDISYKIFGVTSIGGRFLSIFFGTLTILLVYLLGKRIFNEKIALIAAFLFSVSAYFIRYALMEMDEAMIFFVLFSIYLFIKGLEEKKKISYLSVLFMAVAVLIKPIAIPFAFPLIIYFFYFIKKEPVGERKKFLNKNYKRIVLSIILFLFLMMPVFAYNIILYKQKGITDIQFSRFFNINREVFAGLAGYDQTFSIDVLFSVGLSSAFDAFSLYDPAISLLALGGFFLILFKKEYKKGKAIVLLHAIPFIFIAGTAYLATHFASFVPLLSLSAAVFIHSMSKIFKKEKNQKVLIFTFLALVFIINIYLLMPNLTSKSAVFKLRDYAISNFNENDIIIADARIYRGRIAWMLNDKAYLESSHFQELLKINQGLPKTTQADLYFIECVPDDCGWGTISNQPEFNQSVEQLVEFMGNNSVQEKIIYGGGEEFPGEPYFKVYKIRIDTNPQIYSVIYQTHDWFYYPVGWAKDDWYDKYTPSGIFQISLNRIGKTALWIAVITAMLSPVVLLKITREVFMKPKTLTQLGPSHPA